MNTINTNTNSNPKATTHTDATKRRNTADHDHVNDGIKADAVTSAPATFGRPVTPRNVPRATLGDPSCRPHLLPDRGPAPLSFPMPSPSDPANVPPAWVSLPDGSRYIDHAAPQAPRAQPLCAIALYEARTGERLPFRDARGALLEDPFVQQAPVVSGFDVIRHAACAVRARPEAVYAWVELGGESCRVLPYNFIDEVVLCPHARRNEFGHVAVYVYREAPVGTQRDVRGLCAGCRRAQEAIQLMRATEQQFESRELANALDRVKAGVQRGCTPAYVAKLQEWQQELEEACAALVRSLRSAQCRCHGDEGCDAAQPLHDEHWLDLYVRGLLPEPYAVGVAAEAGLTRAQDAARLHWQHRIGDQPLPGGAMLGVVPKGTRRVVAAPATANTIALAAPAAIAKGSDADTTPAPPPTPSRAESAAVDADVGDTSSEGAAASLAMEVASESEADAASDSAADESDAAHDDADDDHGAAEEEPAAQSVVEAVLSSVFDGDDDADHDDGSSDADGASLPHGARDDDVDADESRVSVLQRLFDIPAPTASFNGEPLSSESSLPPRPRRIQTPEKPTGSAATPEPRAPALTTTPPTLSHRPTVASTPDHMMEGHRDAAQGSDRVLPAKPVATPAAAIGTEGYVPTIVLADSADTGTVTTSAKMDPPTTTPLPTNNTTAAADTPAKQPVSAAAKRAAEKEKAKQRRAAQAEREAAAQAEKKAAKAKAAAARAAKQAAREREEEALLERAVEKADASAAAAAAAAASAKAKPAAVPAQQRTPVHPSRSCKRCLSRLFIAGHRPLAVLDSIDHLRASWCGGRLLNANGFAPDFGYPGSSHALFILVSARSPRVGAAQAADHVHARREAFTRFPTAACDPAHMTGFIIDSVILAYAFFDSRCPHCNIGAEPPRLEAGFRGAMTMLYDAGELLVDPAAQKAMRSFSCGLRTVHAARLLSCVVHALWEVRSLAPSIRRQVWPVQQDASTADAFPDGPYLLSIVAPVLDRFATALLLHRASQVERSGPDNACHVLDEIVTVPETIAAAVTHRADVTLADALADLHAAEARHFPAAAHGAALLEAAVMCTDASVSTNVPITPLHAAAIEIVSAIMPAIVKFIGSAKHNSSASAVADVFLVRDRMRWLELYENTHAPRILPPATKVAPAMGDTDDDDDDMDALV